MERIARKKMLKEAFRRFELKKKRLRLP